MTRLVSILVVIILVVMILLVPTDSSGSETPAPSAVSCAPVITKNAIIVKCNAAGVVVVDQTVAIPTVTLPPVTLPPVTGPTITVPVPGPTKTVHVPGPTSIATVTVPGPTQTVQNPGDTSTKYVTVTESALPNKGPTETITVSTTGQPVQTSATVGPTKTPEPVVERFFDRIDTPAKIIGISTLTLLLLTGLGLLVLWLGYVLGYKDADRENANFMAALSDRMLIRGKHE